MTPEAGGGTPQLRPVPLQELRLRADALVWPVDQIISELDSLTPVRGQVWARHHGSVLEVEGEAETIVTLCCDRCLQHFNSPVQVKVHELLELAGCGEAEGSDLTALAGSQNRHRSRTKLRTHANPEPLLIEVLDDRLDPRGEFDPERWLFEQLSLQLPVVNRCGPDCPGPPLAPAVRSGSSSQALSAPACSRQSKGFEGSVAVPSATSPQAIGRANRQVGEATKVQSSQGDSDSRDRTTGSSGLTSPTGASGTSGTQPPIDPRWAALRQLLP